MQRSQAEIFDETNDYFSEHEVWEKGLNMEGLEDNIYYVYTQQALQTSCVSLFTLKDTALELLQMCGVQKASREFGAFVLAFVYQPLLFIMQIQYLWLTLLRRMAYNKVSQ